MLWYSRMHETYGWTRKQIDEEDFEYILDLIVVRAKSEDTEEFAYIDEVF